MTGGDGARPAARLDRSPHGELRCLWEYVRARQSQLVMWRRRVRARHLLLRFRAEGGRSSRVAVDGRGDGLATQRAIGTTYTSARLIMALNQLRVLRVVPNTKIIARPSSGICCWIVGFAGLVISEI